MKATRRRVLSLHSKYRKTLMVYLMALGALKAHFLWQLKPDNKLYQAPPRHMAYALQKPFQEELERLQKQDIIAPLDSQQNI